MSATQQERMQSARSWRARARGDGYLDGLYGVEPRRSSHHPDDRFAYEAGHRDGAEARNKSMGAAA